jgi:hypothetical protein
LEREERAQAAEAEALRQAKRAPTPRARKAHEAEAARHARAAELQHAAAELQAEHARRHGADLEAASGLRSEPTPAD